MYTFYYASRVFCSWTLVCFFQILTSLGTQRCTGYSSLLPQAPRLPLYADYIALQTWTVSDEGQGLWVTVSHAYASVPPGVYQLVSVEMIALIWNCRHFLSIYFFFKVLRFFRFSLIVRPNHRNIFFLSKPTFLMSTNEISLKHSSSLNGKLCFWIKKPDLVWAASITFEFIIWAKSFRRGEITQTVRYRGILNIENSSLQRYSKHWKQFVTEVF